MDLGLDFVNLSGREMLCIVLGQTLKPKRQAQPACIGQHLAPDSDSISGLRVRSAGLGLKIVIWICGLECKFRLPAMAFNPTPNQKVPSLPVPDSCGGPKSRSLDGVALKYPSVV